MTTGKLAFFATFWGLANLSWVSMSQAQGGSLWQQSSARSNMFADKTAHEVGDIVTVIIQESAEICHAETGQMTAICWCEVVNF